MAGSGDRERLAGGAHGQLVAAGGQGDQLGCGRGAVLVAPTSPTARRPRPPRGVIRLAVGGWAGGVEVDAGGAASVVVGQGKEVAEAVPGGQMVGGVLAGGGHDQPHRSSLLGEAAGDPAGVPLPLVTVGRVVEVGAVAVGDHHHRAGAKQRCGVLLPPPAGPGAAGVAGGHPAGRLDGVHVLLAFDHVDDLAGGGGLQHLGEPVEHSAHRAGLPVALSFRLQRRPVLAAGSGLHCGNCLSAVRQTANSSRPASSVYR